MTMPPPRYFTHYWSNSTWQQHCASATDGELLDHIASNVFLQRGVSPGDSVYVVTVLHGALYVLAKLHVAMVVDVETAAAALGASPESLWDAEDHIVAEAATPMTSTARFRCRLSRRCALWRATVSRGR